MSLGRGWDWRFDGMEGVWVFFGGFDVDVFLVVFLS